MRDGAPMRLLMPNQQKRLTPIMAFPKHQVLLG
jgi:hypothetical protein